MKKFESKLLEKSIESRFTIMAVDDAPVDVPPPISVTLQDVEESIVSEHYFTAADAISLPKDRIAGVAHEVNRAYCQAMGDDSQPSWPDAPQWQKDSAMLGVELHLTTPDAGPEASHQSWMAQKLADGWSYGPNKLPDLKQHPCLVPFDQLPKEQQAKDYLFRGVVHALSQDVPPPLHLLTFCVLVLKNGFTVTGESACVAHENFNAAIGREIARENAVEKIWPLLGYELKQKRYEYNPT